MNNNFKSLLIGIVAVFVAIGYFSKYIHKSSPNKSTKEEYQAQSEKEVPFNKPQARSNETVTSKRNITSAPSPEPQNDKHNDFLSDLFPNTSVGADLGILMSYAASHEMTAGPEGAKLLKKIYAHMDEKPIDFFDAAKQGLSVLGDDHPEYRRHLIQMMSSMKVDSSIKLSLLEEELSHQAIIKNTSDINDITISYYVAFDALVRLSADKEIVGPIIKRAIQVQKNQSPAIAAALQDRFHSRFPASEEN